ncbi:transcription factor 20 isoform X1 [Lates japonicus]|uniref:Transcription factor 20 isoform X1 n=1 Tax=Lates japonicus TaxID=270547 RepID=A0AAD3R7V8_LATJO|nr:transcription factor 20 isoform X1 [Lates japonicus]
MAHGGLTDLHPAGRRQGFPKWCHPASPSAALDSLGPLHNSPSCLRAAPYCEMVGSTLGCVRLYTCYHYLCARAVYPEHPASQVSVPGAIRERLRETERRKRHRSLGAVSLDNRKLRN